MLPQLESAMKSKVAIRREMDHSIREERIFAGMVCTSFCALADACPMQCFVFSRDVYAPQIDAPNFHCR